MKNKELKEAGLKVTGPRVKILQILETASIRHLSAEDIYKSLLEMGEETSLATVYRVLTQFESVGIVVRHHFEGGHSIFELDDGEHHDHLVCVKCARAVEFVDAVIEERQLAIAKEKKFRITDHSLYIYGVCEHCEQ